MVLALRKVPGRSASGLREGDVLVADRARGGVGVRDAGRERGAALGDGPDHLRAVAQEPLERDVVVHELLRQGRGRRQGRAQVLERLARLDALAVQRCVLAPDQLLQTLARARVEGVEQLVEVDRSGRLVGADAPAVGDLVGVVAARLQRHVAVGDTRQRRRADRRDGALVQRREIVVDRHLHDGLRAVVELDALDRPDGPAADAHLVALHELAGVVERRRDLVAAAAAEHHQRHEQNGAGNPGEGRYPGKSGGGLCFRAQVRSGITGAARASKYGDRPAARRRSALICLRTFVYSIPSGPLASPERNWRTN